MPKTEYVTNLGKETIVRACWLPCDQVFPELFEIATGEAILPGGSDATINIAPALNEREIIASPEMPHFLQFVDPITGSESLVEVVAPIAAGATTITINPASVKRKIPTASVAMFPPRVGSRSSLNITTEDDEEEIEDISLMGFRNYIKTSLGMAVSMPGHYLPDDAGYNEVRLARNKALLIFLHITLPKPGCDDIYQKGDIYYGAANVGSVPIEIPAKGTIKGNIEAKFSGKITFTRAA